jgi:hypothetical protein
MTKSVALTIQNLLAAFGTKVTNASPFGAFPEGAVYNVTRTFTSAEVTAMQSAAITIQPAIPNCKILVTGLSAKAGAVDNFTSLLVKDTASSPVTIATLTRTNLASSAGFSVGATGFAGGAGFLTAGTVNTSITVSTTGGSANAADATVTISMSFKVVPA